MPTVYRIENKEGEGPYWEFGSYKWRSRDHNGDDHPSPYEEDDDFIKRFNFYKREHSSSGIKFGCPNLKELRKWFNKRERRNLKDFGFFIYKFKVKSRLVGFTKKQCVFLTKDITFKERIYETL